MEEKHEDEEEVIRDLSLSDPFFEWFASVQVDREQRLLATTRLLVFALAKRWTEQGCSSSPRMTRPAMKPSPMFAQAAVLSCVVFAVSWRWMMRMYFEANSFVEKVGRRTLDL